MSRINLNNDWDEEEFEGFSGRRQKIRNPNHKPKRSQAEVLASLAAEAGAQESFNFTYNASRHEREWITNSLGNFYDQQWFSDVLRLLKGGKEASVYQCAANPPVPATYLAAKIYRPRQFRTLKNDQLYLEGRDRLDADGNIVIDGGQHHAMNKRTEYGLQLLHTSWIEHEFKTMQILHAAGADIPVPYARGDNAILMEYIGGDAVPAPTLIDVNLDPDEARLLFERVLRNVELMLAHNRIHADLSAYNILYWEGKITLIDFPQVIDPHTNRNALRIFERDITRVCEYFARQGVRSNPRRITADLWTAFNFRLAPEVDPRYLDDQDEKDLALWRSQMGS